MVLFPNIQNTWCMFNSLFNMKRKHIFYCSPVAFHLLTHSYQVQTINPINFNSICMKVTLLLRKWRIQEDRARTMLATDHELNQSRSLNTLQPNATGNSSCIALPGSDVALRQLLDFFPWAALLGIDKGIVGLLWMCAYTLQGIFILCKAFQHPGGI